MQAHLKSNSLSVLAASGPSTLPWAGERRLISRGRPSCCRRNAQQFEPFRLQLGQSTLIWATSVAPHDADSPYLEQSHKALSDGPFHSQTRG